MREDNRSSALEFILLGVSRKQEQKDFFFILFLFTYHITLIGNLLIILAIGLHNPMCSFLITSPLLASLVFCNHP